MWQSYPDLVLAGHRLTTRTLEVSNTRSRLLGPQASTLPVHTLNPPTWEELARIGESDATAEGRDDEAAARDQRREDVGTAAYGQG